MKIAYYDSYQCSMEDKRRWFLDALDDKSIHGPAKDGVVAFDTVKAIEAADVGLVWNGQEPGCGWFVERCAVAGCPVVYIERGLLPQADNVFLDPAGMGYFSSLGIRGGGGRTLPQFGGRCAIILQLMHDANCYPFTNCRTSEAFCKAAALEAADVATEFIVCPHPRNPQPLVPFPISDRPTLDTPCDMAVGCCSSVMYAMAERGVPIMTFGPPGTFWHPLERAPVEDILAQIRAQQYTVGETRDRLLELLWRLAEGGAA